MPYLINQKILEYLRKKVYTFIFQRIGPFTPDHVINIVAEDKEEAIEKIMATSPRMLIVMVINMFDTHYIYNRAIQIINNDPIFLTSTDRLNDTSLSCDGKFRQLSNQKVVKALIEKYRGDFLFILEHPDPEFLEIRETLVD